MKTLLVSLLATLLPTALLAAGQPQARPPSGEYSIVVEGYDWGAGVSKVILSLDETVSSAEARRYAVSVKRHTDCMDLAPEQASGERVVIDAYVSDPQGRPRDEGTRVTLVLGVAPQWPLSSPLQYFRNERCSGTRWVDYDLTVTDEASGQTWDREAARIIPPLDGFDLWGRFVPPTGATLSYAWFAPETDAGRRPLLIWLHGGGEGGTDPTIPLLANRATSYASDGIQALFGGAYVLVPQCPGAWMHNPEGINLGDIVDDRLETATRCVGILDGAMDPYLLY